jgi:hypothetical protein
MAKVSMTADYTLPRGVTRLTAWEVKNICDNHLDSPPSLDVTIVVYPPVAQQATPYCEKVLRLFDGQASGVLGINASPVDRNDSVTVNQVSITNAYAAYSSAFWANVSGTGTKAKHLAALQELIRSKAGAADGIVSAEFAGT